jgi:hypothetical protein
VQGFTRILFQQVFDFCERDALRLFDVEDIKCLSNFSLGQIQAWHLMQASFELLP